MARSVACYKRTLDHLKSWSFKLPNHLRTTSIKYDETDRNHDGLKVFTYQHIPQLKFHNPEVQFLVTARSSSCTIEFVDNEEEAKVLDVQDKSHQEIKDLVQDLFPQVHSNTELLLNNDTNNS